MAEKLTVAKLETLAAQVRYQIVQMMGSNKAHHFGGSLSATDLVTAIYFYKLRYDPQNPAWPDRDRFIISKGHCVPAQYAALALLGVLPIEELPTLKKLGSRLQGHPAMHYTPGIEGCTGSLGHGLSYANGMALAAMVTGRSYRVYCIVGDGELQEGQNWEAAMTATTRCLSNVTVLVDTNGLKAMDETKCGKVMEPLSARWQSFGWATREINGHNMAEICDALDWAVSVHDAPQAIIAHTVKGKGISFMENQAGFHNAQVSAEQWAAAFAEVKAKLDALKGVSA